MEKDIDSEVIKATQASLGKYVKRPPLSDKLLKKPPFRFLHDIITNVMQTTKFFEGLFDEGELISDNVKDRESKILFLNKVITVVGFTLGKKLAVKPSKVVAGQEAEKTNELLQAIAQALDKNLSSDEAVKKFKNGVKVTKSDEKVTKDLTKKTSEANKLTSKSNEKLTNNQKGTKSTKNDGEKTTISKTKQKEKNTSKTETATKKNSHSKILTSKKNSIEKKPSEIKEDLKDLEKKLGEIENITHIEDQPQGDLLMSQKDDESIKNTETDLNNSCTIVNNGFNSSLCSQDLLNLENNVNKDSLEQYSSNNKNSADLIDAKESEELQRNNINNSQVEKNEHLRLNSTETSAPSQLDNKLKEEETSNANVKAVLRPVSVRPSSSRPGAPRPREKHDNITEAENILVGKVNIITENSPIEEEEDSSIIIVEQEAKNTIKAQDEQEQLQSLNDHGHLVQQILDSQKEYSQMTGKTEIEWQFGVKKARDAVNKEFEQLRFDIQALSRVANPLGKLLDHIQEDVEVMRQELSQWTKTYEDTSKELLKQKVANEDSLVPLYTKVKQLNTDIEEKREKINDLKIIIQKNSSRIEKLLSNGNVQ